MAVDTWLDVCDAVIINQCCQHAAADELLQAQRPAEALDEEHLEEEEEEWDGRSSFFMTATAAASSPVRQSRDRYAAPIREECRGTPTQSTASSPMKSPGSVNKSELSSVC